MRTWFHIFVAFLLAVAVAEAAPARVNRRGAAVAATKRVRIAPPRKPAASKARRPRSSASEVDHSAPVVVSSAPVWCTASPESNFSSERFADGRPVATILKGCRTVWACRQNDSAWSHIVAAGCQRDRAVLLQPASTGWQSAALSSGAALRSWEAPFPSTATRPIAPEQLPPSFAPRWRALWTDMARRHPQRASDATLRYVFDEPQESAWATRAPPVLRGVLYFEGRTLVDAALRVEREETPDGFFRPTGDMFQLPFLDAPLWGYRISRGVQGGPKRPPTMVRGRGGRVRLIGGSRRHTGIDFCAPLGTPIYAAADGVVSLADWHGFYGQAVIVQHEGPYATLYGHMTAWADGIYPGRFVREGEVIGYVGSTGRSTGNHVHYELHVNGAFVDPFNHAPPALAQLEPALALRPWSLLAQALSAPPIDWGAQREATEPAVDVAVEPGGDDEEHDSVDLSEQDGEIEESGAVP